MRWIQYTVPHLSVTDPTWQQSAASPAYRRRSARATASARFLVPKGRTCIVADNCAAHQQKERWLGARCQRRSRARQRSYRRRIEQVNHSAILMAASMIAERLMSGVVMDARFRGRDVSQGCGTLARRGPLLLVTEACLPRPCTPRRDHNLRTTLCSTNSRAIAADTSVVLRPLSVCSSRKAV